MGKSVEHQKQLTYWTQQLEGSQPAELSCDKPRPATLSGEAGEEEAVIDGDLYEKLQEFCKARQVTPFLVLLSAFRATHFRLTGAGDATIGSPIANRNREELEGLVGFFVNLQCLRIPIQDETFEDLIQQVQATAATAFENQDVPFEKIVTELKLTTRDASRNPVVQITFALHNQWDSGRLTLPGLQVESLDHTKQTRFDLEFHLFQREKSLRGGILFAQELFYPETIRNMMSIFYEILRQGLQTPDIPVATLPLDGCLSTSPTLDLQDFKQMDYPRDSSIVDVFRQQAAASPETIAVKDESAQLTYAELDQQSEWLSWWLVEQGLKAETPVGVFAARSCQTIVAFLGVLKANLAYVPLDVNAPPGRIDKILSSIPGPKLVLLGKEAPLLQHTDKEVSTVQIADVLRDPQRKTAPVIKKPSATSLAYIIFTSGSTQG